MKTKGMFALCLALVASPAFAATEQEVEAFKKAFSSYNDLFEHGKYAEALPFAREAQSLGPSIYPADSKSLPALAHNLGRTLLGAREYAEAHSVLKSAREAYLRVYEKDAPELIDLYIDMSNASRGEDYLSNWSRYDDDALAVARKFYGKNSLDYGFLELDIGHMELVNQGARGEQRILDGFEVIKEAGTQHPRWGFANFVRGKVEMTHERYENALEYLNTSIAAIESIADSSATAGVMMPALGFQSMALDRTGHAEEATAVLLRIGKLKESIGDKSFDPVLTVQPEFPDTIRTQTTGTLLNVKSMNEGTVTVIFDVDERGYTTNHRVDLIVGPQAYAAAAIEAIKQFRYAPRFVGGQPVPVIGAKYGFRFLLDI